MTCIQFHLPAFIRTTVGLLVLTASCAQSRPHAERGPAYADDIERVMAERCAACHSGQVAEGGFRVDSYLAATGCPESTPTVPAIAGADAGPALLAVLERPDHASLLDAAQTARLQAWVAAGAPARAGGVHAAGILDPRSPDWHGKLAARDGYGPLKAADHPGVCGRCHAGAPATPPSVAFPAPNAPACTSCHTAPKGVLACGTCHGDGSERAAPPRDACLFPGPPDAHGAHLQTSLTSASLSCTSCHPAADERLEGTHADGHVDVVFDPVRAGADAAYDPATRVCSVACHSRGGARPAPSFDDARPMQCGDCHGAPPAGHYQGECARCHSGAGGNELRDVHLHLNGQVDLGDGSGTCAACHGSRDDPMPATPSHLLHRSTMITASIVCSDCHAVPSEVRDRMHLEARAMQRLVTFGARAHTPGEAPQYRERTCVGVACHGAGLPEGQPAALQWDSDARTTCSSCHGVPPSLGHTRDRSCASLACHGAEVGANPDRPSITELGRAHHIDGQIDTAASWSADSP